MPRPVGPCSPGQASGPLALLDSHVAHAIHTQDVLGTLLNLKSMLQAEPEAVALLLEEHQLGWPEQHGAKYGPTCLCLVSTCSDSQDLAG